MALPRRLVRGVSLALALGVTFSALPMVAVQPAQAAVPAAGEFTPSGSKAREFMVNVISSVLKGATPDKLKREKIANTVKFDFGWETLDAELGGGVVKNGAYLKTPDSYDDNVLRMIELHETGQAKSNQIKKPAKVPASKLAKFEKLVGTATGVMIGAQVGLSVGKGISGLMGFNVDGGLCEPGFEDFGIIGTITGTDCANLYEFHPAYDANGDVVEGVTGGWSCNATSTHCVRMVSEQIVVPWSGDPLGQRVWGFQMQGTGNMYVWYWTDKVPAGTGQAPIQRSDGTGTVATACRNVVYGGVSDPNFGCMTINAVQGDARRNERVVKYSYTNNEATAIVPVESDPNPERTLSCTILGTDGNTYTMDSLPYKGDQGSAATPDCPVLPDGVQPANVKVEEQSPAGTVPVYDEPTTTEFQEWATAYPECRTGACPLYLHKKNAGTAGVGLVNCLDLGETCRDWFSEPNKEDLYQCTYGSHDVALAECNLYEGAFKPERLAVGAPYSDPETGVWSGGQSSPTAGSQLMGSPVQNPEGPRECWPTGWAVFNPVEWIQQPVRCVLEWAFVPRPTVIAMEGVKMQTALDQRAPGQLTSMIGAWSIDPTPMTGCRRVANYSPASAFNTGNGQTVVWDVCPGTEYEWMGTTAKTVVALGFALLVFLAIKRYTGRTVDY